LSRFYSIVFTLNQADPPLQSLSGVAGKPLTHKSIGIGYAGRHLNVSLRQYLTAVVETFACLTHLLTSDSKLTLAYVFDQLVNLTGFSFAAAPPSDGTKR